MKVSTQLAILEDFRRQSARAMTRQDLSEYLAASRSAWKAPQSLGVDALINLLIENDSLKVDEISSDSYGRKARYLVGEVGEVSFLQFASSFYKVSYLSHGTALHLHGLATLGTAFVNHEQSPKNSTSRLTQSGLDRAFRSQQRQSSYVFRYGSRTITFLNGKNTERAGVMEMRGPNNEPLMVTSLERTLIDVIVRPQYAGGICKVIRAFEKAKDHVSVPQLATLLAKMKFTYPYHQALGFVLQKVGMSEESLDPLKDRKIRFRFYLDYGMKAPAFDPSWKIHYPSDL